MDAAGYVCMTFLIEIDLGRVWPRKIVSFFSPFFNHETFSVSTHNREVSCSRQFVSFACVTVRNYFHNGADDLALRICITVRARRYVDIRENTKNNVSWFAISSKNICVCVCV